MKERIIEVNLTFVLKDTNSFPPVSGLCRISAKAGNGPLIQSSHRFDGNTDADVVKTITRMDPFRAKIGDVASQCIPHLSDEEVKTEAPPASQPVSGEDAGAPVVPEKTDKEKERETYDKQREAHYAKIKADLTGKKIGEIRQFVTKHAIGVTTGGKKKEAVVEEIIEYIRQKEALPEE